MAKRNKSTKGRRESGSYVALPHSLLRHENFARLSPRATKLLIDFCSIFNGTNNGDMTTAWSVMKKRGWRSHDQIFKAQTELLEAGFILKTRQGGRNKCNLFALTFLAIDECKGKLDVPATHAPPGDWRKSFSVTRHEGEVNPPRGLMRSKRSNVVRLLTRHEGKSA